jgi:hypothetical protein
MHQKLTNPGMRGLFVTSRSRNNKCSEMTGITRLGKTQERMEKSAELLA